MRTILRLLVTPVVVLSFGVVWVCFLIIVGPAFCFMSYLAKDDFDWADYIRDCNEFFFGPLREIWK